MERENIRVVFMGTPDFAVPSLRALLDAGFNVCGVVTQPDRPRGRGHKLSPCPAKTAAESSGVPVIQMQKITSPEGLAAVAALEPDYVVTAAFGQILTDDFLKIPKKATINVHASLLPEYRGASPIVRAVMNGEKKTGITTMCTVRALDAGPVLLQESLEIGANETGGEVTERLAKLGGKVLVRTLDGMEDGTVVPKEQDSEKATYYPMFSRGYGRIDWNRSPGEIVNFVRALNPAPGAYFMLGDEKVRVDKASVAAIPEGASALLPGTVMISDPRAGLVVSCRDGAVSLDILRRRGKKAMTAKASLNGNPIACGTNLACDGGGKS